MLEGLATILAAVAIAGGMIVIVLMAAHLSTILLHLALRRRGLAEEARRLALPLPAEQNLPHVVVQIPVFNEGTLVERAVEAAVGLDWPKDKLHIQICDDSNDGGVELARAAAERSKAKGFNVTVFHRTDRTEFKAGALREAMARTEHRYFAIFDVDFVPPTDFLRRCMAVLLADEFLAFVQARPDFLNRDENALTRAQAVALDSHHVIDQATRSWAGYPLPFNGTCGIWRREAIEAGGGWRGETLAEDLDLSYRAWFQGWRGIFLTGVAVPGELPANLKAFSVQQRRWILGTGQVIFHLLPEVVRLCGLPARGRLGALIHFTSWWSAPIVSVTVQAAILAIILDRAWLPYLGWPLAALIVLGNAMVFGQYLIANRLLHAAKTSLPNLARDYGTLMRLGFYLGWVNKDVVWKVLLGKRSVFERTEKNGHLLLTSQDEASTGVIYQTADSAGRGTAL